MNSSIGSYSFTSVAYLTYTYLHDIAYNSESIHYMKRLFVSDLKPGKYTAIGGKKVDACTRSIEVLLDCPECKALITFLKIQIFYYDFSSNEPMIQKENLITLLKQYLLNHL